MKKKQTDNLVRPTALSLWNSESPPPPGQRRNQEEVGCHSKAQEDGKPEEGG